jgi:FAD/FMN-containing dehydrogenase
MPDTNAIITALTTICGAKSVITDADETAPYLTDWRKHYTGTATAVVYPGSTDEVSRVLAYANEHGVPIVPQGGNTGLCGGATPDTSGDAIVLSLKRMDQVLSLDLKSNTMVVQAGCILETIQRSAEAEGLLFPLDFGSRGTCRIGGNLSTNAGGLGVVRYGNARALCLGLEVVVPDGRVMNLLSPLKKDNTGYDLKNLFIGSEGTLGIITAATLQLFPAHQAVVTAFAGLRDIDAAISLLNLCQSASGGRVTTFELMPKSIIDNVMEHYPDTVQPIADIPAFSAFIEISSTAPTDAMPGLDGTMPLNNLMEGILEASLEDELINDATIATSSNQRAALWAIRELTPESEIKAGVAYKSDISIPIEHMAEFYHRAAAAAEAIAPGVRVFGFGHLGDGNLHYNLCIPRQGHPDFMALFPEFDTMLSGLLKQYGGSISAEHGIGQKKRHLLRDAKDATALAVMEAIKKALDPNGIMNPGKIL